jgi:hypothetical protein
MRSRPRKVGLLWLTHVRVEVVEITQLLRPKPRIRVSGIVPLVVLDVHEHIVLFRKCQKILVVFKQFHRRLGNENVDAAFDRISRNRIMSCVWCEDRDCQVLTRHISMYSEIVQLTCTTLW